MTKNAKLDVRKVAGSLGAEVFGLNVREALAPDLKQALRQALLDNLVLFFPGQHLDPDGLETFGSMWGPLETFDHYPKANGAPGVTELAASTGGTVDFWHTDTTQMRNPPAMGILSMVKLPPVGGDTMWSNQYLAYEDLSAPMREMLDGLSAVHEHPKKPETGRTEHPVVRVHPETKRRCLFVNSRYTTRITQLSRAESDALLAFLFTHSVDPRFTVRYRWAEGTTAIWDNRCTQHMVVADFSGERKIQRVTVMGEDVEAPSGKWKHFQPTRNSQKSVDDLVATVN